MSRPSNREIAGGLAVQVRCTGLDKSIEKVQRLVEKLKEAGTLAGELASDLGKLEIEIKKGQQVHQKGGRTYVRNLHCR